MRNPLAAWGCENRTACCHMGRLSLDVPRRLREGCSTKKKQGISREFLARSASGASRAIRFAIGPGDRCSAIRRACARCTLYTREH